MKAEAGGLDARLSCRLANISSPCLTSRELLFLGELVGLVHFPGLQWQDAKVRSDRVLAWDQFSRLGFPGLQWVGLQMREDT